MPPFKDVSNKIFNIVDIEGQTNIVLQGDYNNKKVLIKCLDIDSKNAKSEIRGNTRLQGDNMYPQIVGCYYDDSNNICFVFDWIETIGTLEELIEVDFNTIKPFFPQIYKDIEYGLTRLHKKYKLIHGDLQTKNILITKDYKAILIDMDLCCDLNNTNHSKKRLHKEYRRLLKIYLQLYLPKKYFNFVKLNNLKKYSDIALKKDNLKYQVKNLLKNLDHK